MVIAYSNGTVFESEAHRVAGQPMDTIEPDPIPDYDYEGFAASGMSMEDGHYPDTFKFPNHITFSNESKYHGQPEGDLPVGPGPRKLNEGGQWDKLDDGSWSFTPGRTNLKNHSTQELIDYFAKHEKGNKLILPGS
jgi:hypothetical protein